MSDLLLNGDTEPWRCDHCQKLIYNVENGYPAPGAPAPRYLDSDHKNLCEVCFAMGSVIRNSTYWKDLAEKFKSAVGILKPGGNYFPGAS